MPILHRGGAVELYYHGLQTSPRRVQMSILRQADPGALFECAARDIGETPHKAVATCDGRLLRENGNEVRWIDSDGKERGVCYLHPYRFGKNPARTMYPSPPVRESSATPTSASFSPPGSTITLSGIPGGGDHDFHFRGGQDSKLNDGTCSVFPPPDKAAR